MKVFRTSHPKRSRGRKTVDGEGVAEDAATKSTDHLLAKAATDRQADGDDSGSRGRKTVDGEGVAEDAAAKSPDHLLAKAAPDRQADGDDSGSRGRKTVDGEGVAEDAATKSTDHLPAKAATDWQADGDRPGAAFFRSLRRLTATIALAIGLGWMGLMFLVTLMPLPEGLLGEAGPPQTPVVLDAAGGTLAWLPGDNERLAWPVELAEMGDWLPEVVVALEDHRFAEHDGVDGISLAGAVRRNVAAGGIVSGASTVTQQLIKLASERRGRAWRAKVYEALAAMKIERGWSKDRILEHYLNRSVYGNRIVGPEAAARVYFGKPCAELSLAEAVFLAGLPQAPTRFNPWTQPEAARARYQRSIDRLAEVGLLDENAARQCRQYPPVVRRELPAMQAPHFVEYVRERSRVEAAADGGNGVLRTTLDADLQRQAESILRQHLRSLPRRDVREGAIVVIDNRTGAIRAMVGSPDFSAPEGQNNGALMYRSCGSTLKPFLYLKAIADGTLTAASLLPDTAEATRSTYRDYAPENYDSHHWGPVRARVALASSLNVPAVMALSKVGAREMYVTLEDWGFHFRRGFDAYGAGMILGNAEVRLIDLVAGFSALSRGGTWIEPSFLENDQRSSGVVRQLADPAAVAIVTDILCDNEARRRTFGGSSPLATEKRCAVKTGTSSGFRDTWTVGFTRDHTVGVWVGNFDGRPMQEVSSINGAAPLWRAVVDLLLEGDDAVPEIDDKTIGREKLVRVAVCELTGLLPGKDSPGVVEEWFLKGTQPIAGAGEMLREIDGETRLVLPVEYAGWCASDDNRLAAIVEPDAGLKIVHPAPGAVFFLDPQLPREQQVIHLRASSTEAGLVWQIDGNDVSCDDAGGGVHAWQIESGTHRVEVRRGEERVSTEFEVRGG